MILLNYVAEIFHLPDFNGGVVFVIILFESSLLVALPSMVIFSGTPLLSKKYEIE